MKVSELRYCHVEETKAYLDSAASLAEAARDAALKELVKERNRSRIVIIRRRE